MTTLCSEPLAAPPGAHHWGGIAPSPIICASNPVNPRSASGGTCNILMVERKRRANLCSLRCRAPPLQLPPDYSLTYRWSRSPLLPITHVHIHQRWSTHPTKASAGGRLLHPRDPPPIQE
ncbi:hypothetical protein GDO81_029326 [Engystomops pustulosus]|uniref:Uncharacterized protein n=1 Tax=Engystomops pustulosus TaxID=76066 RepID=A0AAV6YJL3_ENGPU|nr:hypothetical protein GDO81_029326 [Engystomops pustulosus]